MDKHKILVGVIVIGLSFFVGFYFGAESLINHYQITNHQTLIAAILAFLGTASGGYFIGKQISQKEQHRRDEIESKESYIAASILGEIRTNMQILNHNGNLLRRNVPNHFQAIKCESRMFDLLCDRVGELENETAYKLHKFYSMASVIEMMSLQVLEEAKIAKPSTQDKKQIESNVTEIKRYCFYTLSIGEEVVQSLAKIAHLPEYSKFSQVKLEDYDDYVLKG